MKKLAFLFLAFGFITLTIQDLEAAKPQPCRKVGYRNRRNPERLAKKLTEGLQDDSLKVLAIYDWITCNISYDIESFLNYDLMVSSTRNILRTRKTTCYGYAMLFKELCEKSGVRAEIVTGYTKNISVDINDSFFVGDHAWNTAYIHGRWYLFDPTWDAGHVITYRMRRLDKILYFLSFKRYERYVDDPEFVKEKNYNYAFKSGDYFLYNHLPENPIWQLTDKIWTDMDFRSDSSWYYLKDPNDTDSYSLEFENERQTYDLDDDTTIQINDGIAFKHFNFKNELGHVHALNLKNSLFFKATDLSSTDTAEMLRLADSLCYLATITNGHLDSLDYYIALEEAQKLNTMKRKNAILVRDIKTLNKSSDNLKKACIKGDFYVRYYKRSVRSYLKSNYISVVKAVKDPRYQEQDCKSKSDEKQQEQLDAVDSLQLLIDSLEYVLDNQEKSFEQLQSGIYDRIKTSIEFQDEKLTYLYYIKFGRLNQFDDLDYFIRKYKDSLMTQNAFHDTDLFTNKKLIYDSLTVLHKSITALYKHTLKLRITQLNTIRKYKSTLGHSQKYKSDTLYNQSLRDLIGGFNELSGWMVEQAKSGDRIQRSSNHLKAYVRVSKRITLLERHFISKPKLIKQRTKALKTISKYQRNKAESFARRCKTIRSRYAKK